MIQRHPYSFPIDVWASGVLLFNLIFGRCPFQGKTPEETYDNILKKPLVFDEELFKLSKPLKNLMRRMLEHDDSTRITIPEILNH